MDWIENLFGQGEELTTTQMSLRAAAMFFVTLILIRISGRRSFSFHSAPDNIISITLGAILSRAIVGASPFIGVVAAGLVIALLHRWVLWMGVHNKTFKRLLTGKKILVYEQGSFHPENMRKALICQEEIMQAVSEKTHKDNLDSVEQVYLGSSGEIIVVTK
jgi:uncharacterized membrane protein YcaP (DUF421 family)